MFDEIRNTILYYIKEIGLPIVDGIEKEKGTSENVTNLIFEKFVNTKKTKLKGYLEKDFNLYGIKKYPNKIPILSNLSSSEGKEIKGVTNYENNVISLESPLLSTLYENFSKIRISTDSEENKIEDGDYIQIHQNSFFTIKKNINLTENYARYDILFYLKDDGNELKSNYYSKKISQIFDSNKKIIIEKNVETDKLIYIKERVQTDVFTNNVIDKILRCTMLIKYY